MVLVGYALSDQHYVFRAQFFLELPSGESAPGVNSPLMPK
jgi:hypothetical protein